MKNQNHVILTKDNFLKLNQLIDRMNSEAAELLKEELDRAIVVNEMHLPDDVVSMNSKVKFCDLETGKETVVTIVYPQEANIEENKISVLAPVGSALIGLSEGQIIDWPVPSGKAKRFKIISVLSQPKSA